MSDYPHVLSAIFEYVDYSRTRQIPYNASTYNLERMRELCTLLGEPQDRYPSLHIAGSKGKGSTAAMISAILQAAGYRTGLYTSPHLHSFRERIRVDGDLISREDVVRLWEQIRPQVDALHATTTFEIITALAFEHFRQKEIDWAVLEVGLGGRLDATNVVTPAACAITPLSYEHTDLLGHTLSLIAFEKAGIIKPGVPVIVGPQTPEAMAVIEEVAAQAGAELCRVEHDWRCTVHESTHHGLRLDIHGPGITYENLALPLVGGHQAINATVAVALTHTLIQGGVAISADAIRKGLAQTFWPGRLERLSQNPLIVVDSAHNSHSTENLRASLNLFPHHRLILLFGASVDKDIHSMLQVLGPIAAEIIITRSFHPRAAEPAILADLARLFSPHTPIHTTENALEAVKLAHSLAEEGDLILGTGSIFVVADVRESWNKLHPDAFAPTDWVHSAEPIDGDFAPMLPGPEYKK